MGEVKILIEYTQQAIDIVAECDNGHRIGHSLAAGTPARDDQRRPIPESGLYEKLIGFVKAVEDQMATHESTESHSDGA